MDRYNTVRTMIEMVKIYDVERAENMREKYHLEGSSPLTVKQWKKIVNHACWIAENAQEMDIEPHLKFGALVHLGVCIDALKWNLDWEQSKKDRFIDNIEALIAKERDEKKASMKELLEKSNQMIDEKTWEDICKKYRLPEKKSSESGRLAVSEHWHRIIVGRAVRLAKKVIGEGGSEEDIRLALTYLKACIDCNKHMLDVTRFRQENGLIELKDKYGIEQL